MINSSAYFAILYSLVAAWATTVMVLLVLGVRRRRVRLVVIAIVIAWGGPAAMMSIEALLGG